jgi:hypothetical protein
MDDLTRVREFESDIPSLTDEARRGARGRLYDAIAQESRQARSAVLPRRLVFRVAAAATVAAAVAGTVVVATRDDRTPNRGRGTDADTPRMTTLSAAQVLIKAADRSRSTHPDLPIPRNDQYLYTKTYTRRRYKKDGKVKTWTDESWMSVDGSKPSRRVEYGKVHIDPPLGKHQVPSFPTVYSKLEKLPTDPHKLLKEFNFGAPVGDPHAGMMAFSSLTYLMMGPRVMPPGLEAAAFEALALLPDIKLNPDQFDAIGRHGIGVSYPHFAFTFIFDPKTYTYLGLMTEGYTLEHINGKWKDANPYYEMRSLEKLAVVDHIGQQPQP